MKNKLNRLWLLTFVLLITSSCLAQTPTQTLSVAGLKDSVVVRRDERGIPYIEAKNETDLYFAQGYVTASDRLWQMDLYRRLARGETAEIFGKTTLEEDKRWRKFNFARIAEEAVKNASPDNRLALENYARGVNAYIAALNEKNLPVEFQILQYRPRDWTTTDSLVVSKIFDDALSNSWRMDLIKASLMNLPKEKQDWIFNPASPLDVILVGKDNLTARTQRRGEYLNGLREKNESKNLSLNVAAVQKSFEIETLRQNSLTRAGFYAEDLAASNNWVISGKRTADGKPLLANDPHLRPAQPSIWYLVNLSAPNVRVAGVSTPGIPGVIIGHNENIAWGSTNVGPDVQDLYVEAFDANGKYKTPQGMQTPVTRREEIKVRKNPFTTETDTETLEVVETRNGVIVLEEAGKKYALKWTAFDAKNDSLAAFSALAKAKNWTDFRGALKSYAGAMQNFVYADRAGNVGWIAAGKVPIRKTGDGSLPYDGATDAGDWTGFIPFDELPQLYNPPEGFIMTANQRTVGKSYKYHNLIARVNTPMRARRLDDLLKANSKVTVDNVRDFQFDTFSVGNAQFARETVNLKAGSEATLNLLAAWDGRMNKDSKAGLLADTMRGIFRLKIINGNFSAEQARNLSLPYDAAFFYRIVVEKPKEWLPKEFASYADLLKACEREARTNLTKQFGADESLWTWGNQTKSSFPHPLAVAPLVGGQFVIEPLPQNGAGGGGSASPNVGAAVSMRFIAAPADWDLTRQVIPTGESGDPKSAHWKDQLDAWYSGNTPIFPFTKAAVDKAAKDTILLVPQK